MTQHEKDVMLPGQFSWYTYFQNEHYVIIAQSNFIKCSFIDGMLAVALK